MSSDVTIVSIVPSDLHILLREQISDSLHKAEAQQKKLQTIDRRYGALSLVLAASAALIAGQSALTNSPLIKNWQFTSALSTVLTLGAAIAAGAQKQLAPPDRLSATSDCVAKLKVLKGETLGPVYDLEPVSEAYQQILSEFSRIDC